MSNRDTFVKVSVDLDDHPAWIDLDPEHVGLWLLALLYCQRNRTDGHFPGKLVRRWGGEQATVDELVAAGRWHAPGHDCPDCPEPVEGSLYVHGYLDYHYSRARIDEVAEKRREAGRAGGRAKAARASDQGQLPDAKQSASNAGSPDVAESTQIADSRSQKKDPPSRPARAAAVAADFDEFWTAYPRKVGRKDAERKYAAARKGTDAQTILDGLARAIELWRAERREVQFVPHPATWLNQGRWSDEHPSLPGTADERPAGPALTAMQCNRPDCPGTRHEWADARNRYFCQGA